MNPFFFMSRSLNLSFQDYWGPFVRAKVLISLKMQEQPGAGLFI